MNAHDGVPPEVVGYETLDAYARAIVRVAGGDRRSVPCLLPGAALAGQAGIERGAGAAEGARTGAAPFAVLAERSSPASLSAQLLAAWFGAPLELVDALSRHAIVDAPGHCIVELAGRIGDGLLATAMELDDPPCFVTADDIGALSRYVARLIAASPTPDVVETFRMLVTAKEGNTQFSLERGGGLWMHIDHCSPEEAAAVLAESAGVLVAHGHGGESCAHGGGLTVLCGRRAAAPFVDDGGDLACHKGPEGCQRGAQPFLVSKLRARHVMLGSCSSGRLADSSIASRYNLTRAFVEGAGLSMVGSTTGGGRPECGLLYLAAMADGLPFGRTVALLNRFLRATCAGQPVYVGYGLPSLRVAGERGGEEGGPASPVRVDELPTALDLGERHVAFLRVRDADAIAACGDGDLALAIEGEADVCWFGRVEGAGPERDLALTIFSFPAPLRGLRISRGSRRRITEALDARLAGFRRWSDYHRLHGGTDAPGVRAAQRCLVSHADVLPVAYDRLAFDGNAIRMAGAMADAMDADLAHLRDELMDALRGPLTGGFWLTNALAPEHAYLGAERATCPACKGVSFRRALRGQISGERRVATVCMRCGIIEDIRIGSAIAEIRVSGRERVPRGGPMSMRVEVITPREDHELVVVAALSGSHQPKIPAQMTRLRARGGAAAVEFTLQIPADVPPHEYRWKCLVADGCDLAFASRCTFVTRGQDEGVGGSRA